MDKKGLVHIYTGDGKGKTTAAVGLGIRAYGRGFRVLLLQFLKDEASGELMTIDKLGADFQYYRTKKVKGFFWNMNDEQKKQLGASEQEVLEYAEKAVSSDEWDMIILDEVLGSISNGLVSLSKIERIIRDKPERLEIVLTGRGAPADLIELADYVSEIKSVKHPFKKGIPARKGIED